MRSALVVAISLALAASTLDSVAAPTAAATPAEAAVTTQLPRTVRPSHYAIEVTPDAAAKRFTGKVSIQIEVLEPTAQIVLHAADMQFSRAQLSGPGIKAQALTATLDADNQTASFTTGTTLAPGMYTFSTDYSGVIGTQANGLFVLDYATESGTKRGLYTQFENSDARRFVPSWDEPNYKATFDLTVNVPADQMAVSNMPVAKTSAAGKGLQKVQFQTTPKMSTYLLFLSVGEFERTAVMDSSGTEIGVIAQKGKVDQAQYVMQASGDILREFNDYFGVKYPLPKLDNIAAPGRSQFFSAMENWGAIFTFEHTLLLDPRVATVTDEQRIFSVAAHEIAHQWFGNLVTMAWWDDLWLNEGFATWMEGRTTQKLHPEWDRDSVAAAYDSRAAMGRDAFATTHPVIQHVETVEQASQAFDGITYGKGGAVIAMLEDYVGAQAWQAGVSAYIAKHAYGNAVTDALWTQMDAAAPGKQFMQVAHNFTLQPGVPLIKMAARCVGGNTQVTLEQGEFSVDNPGKAPLHWLVPVNLRAGEGIVVKLLVDGNASAQFAGCAAPVVVNAGQKGYYRTLYAPAQFTALSAQFNTLPSVDQLGVLMDVSALAAVGQQPEADLLGLLAAIPLTGSTDVWQTAARTLSGMDELFSGDAAAQARFRRFARARLSPVMAQLGWENHHGDSAQTKQLRSALIGTLSRLGEADVVAQAQRRFVAYQADADSLPADLRRTVLAVVARNADAATWDALRAMANKETSSLLREQYFELLGQSRDAALAQRALEMALTDEPGATGGAALLGAVSRQHPQLAFDFATAHRQTVDALVDTTSRARFYPGLASGASDVALAAKVRAFAQDHIAPTSRRDAQTVAAAIETAAKLKAQRRPQIDAWLQANGY